MEQKEFFELAKNRNLYTVLKTLPAPLDYTIPGDRYYSDTLYNSGYNIEKLVAEGFLESAEEPFEWQKQLVGKNVRSVKVWCPECQSFGTNMPLEIACGNCGHPKGVTYYDAQTIQNMLAAKK